MCRGQTFGADCTVILDSQPMIAKCSHGDAGTEGQTSIVCDNQCSNRIIDRHVVVSEVGQIDVTRSLWIQSDIAGDKPAQHNWRQGRRVPRFFREDRVDTGCPGVAPFFLCKVEAPPLRLSETRRCCCWPTDNGSGRWSSRQTQCLHRHWRACVRGCFVGERALTAGRRIRSAQPPWLFQGQDRLPI